MKRSTAPIVRWLASLNLIALLLAAVFGSANTAQAVNRNWLGNTDANFNTAANWSGAIAGQTAVFNAAGSSGTTLNNDIVGLTLAGMTFSATAPAYTITNQSITLGGKHCCPNDRCGSNHQPAHDAECQPHGYHDCHGAYHPRRHHQ